MKNYPIVQIPYKLIAILSEENFKEPILPIEPKLPTKQNTLLTILCSFISGILFFYISPIIGIIVILSALFLLFTNLFQKNYENSLKTYEKNLINYNNELDFYNSTIGKSKSEINQIMKSKKILSFFKDSPLPSFKDDYKKGASHDFFKIYLNNSFYGRIQENATLDFKGKYAFDHNTYEKKRTYICDFSYTDYYNGIFIGIEIDEPYTLSEKTPIHLNDYDRNEFFIENKWIVIRFAEEQIINNPKKCCLLIKEIHNAILNGSFTKEAPRIETILPKVQIWTRESVELLIQNRHRENLLLRMEEKKARMFKITLADRDFYLYT